MSTPVSPTSSAAAVSRALVPSAYSGASPKGGASSGFGGAASSTSFRFSSVKAHEDEGKVHATSALDWADKINAKRQQKVARIKERTAGCCQHLQGHGKRMLRLKLRQVFVQVAKRRNLQKTQDQHRTFRERRFRQGIGPPPHLGDHDDYALGLVDQWGEKEDEMGNCASPRRVAILDILKLDELDQIRQDSTFFFVGAFDAVEEHTETGNDVRYSAEDEDLIEFFTPSESDKGVPVALYAKRLRQRVSPPKENFDFPTLHDSASAPALFQDEGNRVPLEMMPCLGSRKATRTDEESETLRKVHVVLDRREAADAKLLKDREVLMGQKTAVNAFKSKDQLKEANLHKVQMQELHKLRVLDQEERKMMQEAYEQERVMILEAQKYENHVRSELKCERSKAYKRDLVTQNMMKWEEKKNAAQQRVKMMEIAYQRSAGMKWDTYDNRLDNVGVEKHTQVYSQVEKNDQLKKHLQGWTRQQMIEHQNLESAGLIQEIHTKQASAAARRNKNVGNRYKLIERAFGSEAIGVNIKDHSNSVDRRCDSWLKSATSWEKEKRKTFG